MQIPVRVLMPPKSKCSCCGANDRLQSEHVGYIPPAANRGTAPPDGLHVGVWMCKICWLLMQFGSSK